MTYRSQCLGCWRQSRPRSVDSAGANSHHSSVKNRQARNRHLLAVSLSRTDGTSQVALDLSTAGDQQTSRLQTLRGAGRTRKPHRVTKWCTTGPACSPWCPVATGCAETRTPQATRGSARTVAVFREAVSEVGCVQVPGRGRPRALVKSSAGPVEAERISGRWEVEAWSGAVGQVVPGPINGLR